MWNYSLKYNAVTVLFFRRNIFKANSVVFYAKFEIFDCRLISKAFSKNPATLQVIQRYAKLML